MMSTMVNSFYPDIDENESNFVLDYLDMFPYMDRLISFQYGERIFEFEDDDEIPGEWDYLVDSIVIKNIQSYARLYFALAKQYNPIYNVDGDVITTYGKTKDTSTFGESTIEINSAEKQTDSTNASRTNQSTDYATTYPNTTRHESTHLEQSIGGGTDTMVAHAFQDTTTNLEHIDTRESDSHTVSERRFGNIGVVSTTKLLSEQWDFYKNNFFDMIFKQILLEMGGYYE